MIIKINGYKKNFLQQKIVLFFIVFYNRIYIYYLVLSYRYLILKIRCPNRKIHLVECHDLMDIFRNFVCRVDVAPENIKIKF